MLKIITVNDTIEIDAAAWHVDESYSLHLSSADKKPVASFAPTKWIAVVKIAAK